LHCYSGPSKVNSAVSGRYDFSPAVGGLHTSSPVSGESGHGGIVPRALAQLRRLSLGRCPEGLRFIVGQYDGPCPGPPAGLVASTTALGRCAAAGDGGKTLRASWGPRRSQCPWVHGVSFREIFGQWENRSGDRFSLDHGQLLNVSVAISGRSDLDGAWRKEREVLRWPCRWHDLPALSGAFRRAAGCEHFPAPHPPRSLFVSTARTIMDPTVASFDSGQRAAWDCFLRGENVAVVGPAGCGKSRVLMPCIAEARRRYGEKAVLVMSWTWTAALQIDGQTYHSYLGASPTDLSKERTLQMIRAKPRIRSNLEQSRVVVIDEAPTFPGRHFVLLEFVLRCLSAAHMQGKPWGGRQVLCKVWVACLFVSGFVPFQVLYVSFRLSVRCLCLPGTVSCPSAYPMLCVCMAVVAGDPCQLGPVLHDETSSEPLMYETPTWRQTVCGVWGSVHLLAGTHRHNRDRELLGVLRRLRVGHQTDTDICLLNATSEGVTAAEWDACTQVRATNAAVDAVNNDRMARLTSPGVEFVANDEVLVGHPTRRRYAMDRLEGMVAAKKVFKVGAVVISTRTIEAVPPGTQGKVASVMDGMYVVCEFGGRVVRVLPHAFDMVDNCGVKLATRTQIPLVLGWAVTMHRCQGLSLDTLAIDFSKQTWKKEGLVYSGLTRCRTLGGLMVRGLRHDLIVVSGRASRFYGSCI